MYKPYRIYNLAFTVALFFIGIQFDIQGQDIEQISNGESQRFDSNYEQPLNFDGIGHYTSYIDDRVMVFNLDTNEKIYETDFDLCEEGMVDWFFSGKEVIYVSYQGIKIENISNDSKEEYFYEDLEEGYLYNGLTAYIYQGILTINFFPNADKLNFDIANRRFLDEAIANHEFTTSDYFYHSTGFFGDSHFIRFNRNTYESDTLLSNYTPQGFVRSTDKFYLLTIEFPILVVDKNNMIKTYDFEHERISSGVETSTGRLILAEGINGGTIIYEIDIATSSLVRKDTILSSQSIMLVDTYQDRIYVKYSSQNTTNYGFMDHPYTEVEILTEDLKDFSKDYTSQYDDTFIIVNTNGNYLSKIIIIEKSSGDIEEFELGTTYLFLDNEIEVLSSVDGIRLIVSEETGKAIYKYDNISNTISRVNEITNNRGLGTSIQKNGDGYLLVDEHNVQSGFEYIHPETKDLISHQVDGIIYGDVIPYNGKYFYARNQDHQGPNEDYFMDFVAFDPLTNNIKLLEEDYFFPKGNFFPSNIISTSLRFGFVTVNNTPLVFDLRKEEKITPPPEISDLIRNIYFESENYFYSYNGSFDKIHVRVDKDNYENQQLIYEDNYRKILVFDNKSFVAIYPNEAYFVEEDKVTTIAAPVNFNSTFADILETKLMLRGFSNTSTFLKSYDLVSDEEINIEVEGIAVDIIGDYIISLDGISPPYELISTHITSGETYRTSSIEEYSRIFKTDTSVYVLNRELNEIHIFNLKWEQLDALDISLLENSSIDLISKPNTLPLLFKTQVIKSSGSNRNELDFGLLLFDPRTKQITKYFECNNNLRFKKEFEIGPKSTLLLRTEEVGYQLHEVNFPGFGPVSTEEISSVVVDTHFISPNPTSKDVTINEEYKRAFLFNSMGQFLNTYENQNVINLEMYSNGVYILNVILKTGKNSISKIVKQ